MTLSPQLRLAAALTTLMISAVFVADLIGMLPRPDEQIRESRQLIGETLAVQLSSAASLGDSNALEATLREVVARHEDILHAGLFRSGGQLVAGFGDDQEVGAGVLDFSTLNDLVIPIFDDGARWGEARIAFSPIDDWGLRYLGIPATTLSFILFLSLVSLAAFYIFLRKALTELNPSKAVPERVHSAFNVLSEGVMILDESGRIVLTNDVFSRLVGEDSEMLVGRSPLSFRWDLSGDDLEQLPWQTALETGERVTGMPLKLLLENDTLSFNVNVAPIEDGRGQSRGVLITFDDVTPLEAKNRDLASMLARLSETQRVIEEKNRELEHLATRDPLTGCLNRRSFLAAYARCFAAALKQGKPLSVLMLDIDHFKKINDTYGHMVGDQAIKAVADVLVTATGERVPVGRYGGEEFIVALPQFDTDSAVRAAEQLRKAISRLAGDDELPLDAMTVSIGVASLQAGIKQQEVLIDQADKALYRAKESGRNRVCPFDGTQPVPTLPDDFGDDDYVEDELERTSVVQKLQLQLQDIRKLVKEQATEITRKSMYDEFTGLPNRLLLQDRLAQVMVRAECQDKSTAVVSIGLSGYRRMAELAGFNSAEEMVRGAAQRIETVIRSTSDLGLSINEDAATCSRIGESELALLLVNLNSIEIAPKVVDQLTKALEKPFNVAGNEITNDVNCGISFYPNDGAEAELLIRNASLARNHAERRSPRSDAVFFSRDIDSLAAKNRNIATELRKSIANDGLDVYYQPKVDSISQKLVGVEALARWHHPEMGHVGPAEFIAIAENIGVIDQLTDWVWSRVCDDISSGRLGDIPVSINVSPIELYDSNTSKRLLNIVQGKGVAPERVEVEITESSILDNLETARQILSEMQDAGMLVVLDDFGTAYSSLNLLLEIPVDVIKIDRCFVSRLHDIGENRAVVQAIIQMAGAMGKRIVAEGVETVDERDCLLGLGCREMQGYLYSKPLTRQQLEQFVADHGTTSARPLADTVAFERIA